MTLGEHQQAFSRDLVKLMSKAFELGYEIRIGEVERTIEQQKIYVQTGRSKTMNSNHLKKCAADLHFVKAGELCYPQELGDYWETLNPINSWGGNWAPFKDKPHFERRAP
jgi:peptidoglycan L-alanyl-D-glutamate endopeptidase CwlK